MELRQYQKDIIINTKQAILQGYKSPCIVAPCGSGKTVIISEIVKGAAIKHNHTLILVHRQELVEQIKNTLIKNNVNMNFVHVGMVQTITNKPDSIHKPKIIITDECHHAPAKSYKKIYDYFDAISIGFTATPIRLNGGGLGDVYDTMIETITVTELIENNYLSPYKYYAPAIVDTSNLRSRAGDFIKKDIADLFNNKDIYGDVIGHYKKLCNNESAIVYCSSIKQSKEVAEIFTDAGIKAQHIDGKTTSTERENIIQSFRDGKVKVICNVDLISEGFDVPDCTAVIMLRPTQSLSLYIQQSMRSMRYKPGKTAIIIDHVGNIGRFGLPDTNYIWDLTAKKTVADVVKRLQPVIQCPQCFMTLKSGTTKCECGYNLTPKERKQLIINDELIEVDKEKIKVDKMQYVKDRNNPKECQTFAELAKLGKKQGYKPGWAYHQGKLLGLIK